MTTQLCRIVGSGDSLELVSPAFSYVLRTSSALSVRQIKNRLCEHSIDLNDSLELAVDLDQADGRTTIAGWKVKDGPETSDTPDGEEGYRNGFYRYDFPDAQWEGIQSPIMFEAFKFARNRFKWARTHVFLPRDYAGKKITWMIGGMGLMDFGYCRLFINGREIAVRTVESRWHEPGSFVLDVTDEAYSCLRFGYDNLVAIQLTHYLCRDQKIDRYDPQKGRELATIGRSWPGQFEQGVIAGRPLRRPLWRVTGQDELAEGDSGRIDLRLASDDAELAAVVSYRWDAVHPVLRKFISISNKTGRPIRLMNIHLGEYQADMDLTDGEQGFPVYINGCIYMAIAHPSGWAMGQANRVKLMQYPGYLLQPGETYQAMETVLGFAPPHQAREAFIRHIETRMRRIRRGHDRAVASFDSFGSWPIRPLELDYGHFPDEQAILHNLDCLTDGQLQDGCHFDYYTIEFWNDYYGDFIRPGTERFPNGFAGIKEKLAQLDTGLGLWIDTSAGRWSIGGNPAIKDCQTYQSAAYQRDGQVMLLDECYCRAADPYRTMLTNGLIEQIRQNNIRLLKLDDAMAVCHNPHHEHLPGIYSIEAIQNAEIDMLQVLDREAPDLFIVLYWGHRSPWWLLYGDTIFESGLFLEASTPASFPTLYARDGVTVTLDQANLWRDDIPLLGKDSLGVWLSSWAWNSSIGHERWQESTIMDLCRGSLIFQFWSDAHWLSSAERKQAALFLNLLKQNEDCFRNSRLIIGSPWRDEPYGYCCSSGKHAFVAINNCAFADLTVSLALDERWDLANGMTWDIYQWYPEMRQAAGHYPAADTATIAMRPFEVVLLEILPAGEKPAMQGEWTTGPMVSHFPEPTVKLALNVQPLPERQALTVMLEDFIARDGQILTEHQLPDHEWQDTPKRIKEKPNMAELAAHQKKSIQVSAEIPACPVPGLLYFTVKMKRGHELFKLNNLGMHFAAEAKLNGQKLPSQTVIGELTYAVPWQGWRMAVSESLEARRFEMMITAMIPDSVEIECEAYLIPESVYDRKYHYIIN